MKKKDVITVELTCGEVTLIGQLLLAHAVAAIVSPEVAKERDVALPLVRKLQAAVQTKADWEVSLWDKQN